MRKHNIGPLQIIAAMALCASPVVAAAADTPAPVFPGPYSSWTSEQKTQAVQILNQESITACQSYLNDASKGQAATSEAVGCVSAYYVDHVPPDYPNLDSLKKNAAAYESAQKAGATGPSAPGSPPL